MLVASYQDLQVLQHQRLKGPLVRLGTREGRSERSEHNVKSFPSALGAISSALLEVLYLYTGIVTWRLQGVPSVCVYLYVTRWVLVIQYVRRRWSVGEQL